MIPERRDGAPGVGYGDVVGSLRGAGAVLIVALVALGLVVLGPSSPSQAQVGVEIPDTVWQAVEAGEAVELIVSTTTLPTVAKTATTPQVAQRLEATAGIDIEHRFNLIPAVTTTVDSLEELQALAANPDVAAISLGSQQATRYLVETIEIVGADTSHAAGVRGAGTTVAVVDGGAQANHPDLSSSVVFEACFIYDLAENVGHCPGALTERFGPGSAPDDSLSHGTYATGIITSDGVLAPVGVAPDADVEIYKLFDEGEGGYLSDLVRTLEYIAANRPNVDVVNMSFGYASNFPGVCDTSYTALFDAIEVLRARGVVAVAASGNLSLATMGAPACLSNVISVGASADIVGQPEFGQVASISNVSTVTDVVAPGTQIQTSRNGGTTAYVQGTSFSAAVVSACAALVHESGLLTATAIENRVRASSTTAANPGGRALPLVDCAVDVRPDGNVNCDAGTDIVDALVIAQFVVSIRSDVAVCPLTNNATQINASGADLNGDSFVDIVDALLISQCVVGIDNPFCL